MHDEDVESINYLKLAFLERISVCIKGRDIHIPARNSDFVPAGKQVNAWSKYFVSEHLSYRNSVLSHHFSDAEKVF